MRCLLERDVHKGGGGGGRLKEEIRYPKILVERLSGIKFLLNFCVIRLSLKMANEDATSTKLCSFGVCFFPCSKLFD